MSMLYMCVRESARVHAKRRAQVERAPPQSPGTPPTQCVYPLAVLTAKHMQQ